MKGNFFNQLYPILSAIARGQMKYAATILKNMDKKDPCACGIKETAAKEAVTILSFMDGYEQPPELPFVDVTPEQIRMLHDELKDEYGFIIWTNRFIESDELCAELARSKPETYLGHSEDEMRDEMYDCRAKEWMTVKDTFESIYTNGLIITNEIIREGADVQVFKIWNGLENICSLWNNEEFNLYRKDGNWQNEEFTLYIKDGQLQAEHRHYDGVTHFVFYTCLEGRDPEDLKAQLLHGKDLLTIWYDDLDSLVPFLDGQFEQGPEERD